MNNESPPVPPVDPGAISASQWRQIVNSATDTAIISLTPEGRVSSWNSGAAAILGWTEGEMLGQTLERVFPPESGGGLQLRRELEAALKAGRGGEEGWRLRRDGSRIWAIGEVTVIRDANNAVAGFTKILRDRTAQRQAQEELAEERRSLGILNRAGTALSSEQDVHKLVQIVTDAGVELTGAEFGAFFYNITDDKGESYMLYTLSGVPREAFSKFPMPRNTEVFAPTFNGEGIVRSDDITKDARYGKNAPRKGMPEGHLPVRSYLAVPVMSSTSGVIGGLFFGHASTGVFTERSESGLAALAAEAAVAIENARLSMAAQREIRERTRAEEALRDLNANLEKQVAERTEQLRQQEQALRQTQKMEAIGQLTGGVAHDFNNLLQVITSNLEILRRGLDPGQGRLQRAAGNAMAGTQRAAALTQRLLAFARRQPLDPKRISVNLLVKNMSDLLHRTIPETIAIETVCAAGLWWTEADPNELESAIINLAVNARDAMPEGGRLTIETGNSHIDELYAASHAELRPGQYVSLSISDTGSGMDGETLSRAFEPFFTTKAVGKGTGLGLSQVYGFVKQSGGHVKIYSEPGHGTTVRIYLPRAAGEQGGGALPEEAASLAPEAANAEVILVVEDDADVRATSVESLRELGYHVIEAHDGPTALRVLEREGRVDLIFTDVVLPGGLTGAQVADQAVEKRPDLKVLFTTGYARNAIVHHGRLDKGRHLITKPFSFADLASKVRDVLDGM